MDKGHTFHLPVMGIAFTIDTPLKVAQYGIDSVIFITDDILLEKMRKMYSEKFNLPFQGIDNSSPDGRSNRITSYLNMMKGLVEKKFDELKNASFEKGEELKKYFDLLPDASSLKQEFLELTEKITDFSEIKNWLNENLSLGDINVNIMTKIDKVNYFKKEALPQEYNDAHSAFRGFAESDLDSSVIFSAGMNPRLYSFVEQFDDFYPNENGKIKKRIILKVSDYRSALIQGKFLAKKGIWVSEYRVESGLNCGGHAFATEGYLMGPILAEFRDNRQALVESVTEILTNALEAKGKVVPTKGLEMRITTQGGVGTAEEHQFLIDEYGLDSVGWGTPFLLVPEATNVDEKTMDLLMGAKEKDLYLSEVSPLGVPFNNIRGASKDIERQQKADGGRPGSSCPREYLALNGEFTEKTICTASRQYQRIKLKELDNQQMNISTSEYQERWDKITGKSCLCVGLGTTVMKINSIDRKVEGDAVSICPGPNMAYFNKSSSLKDMIGHVYGRNNVISRTDRPNIFVKELGLYLDYLKKQIDETTEVLNRKQVKYFNNFTKNMEEGIRYYQGLFSQMVDTFDDTKSIVLEELSNAYQSLNSMTLEIEKLKLVKDKVKL